MGIVWIPDHLERRQLLLTRFPAIAFIVAGFSAVVSLAILSPVLLVLAERCS